MQHIQNTSPLVSIVLPTWNRAQLLQRAVKSIRDQTFRNFELIIVDDGSTDNTQDIIRSFHDPRIRSMLHEQNKGLMASRNTGVRETRGLYLAFQDSDDWWHPLFLEETVHILEHASKQVGAAYCRMQKRFLDGTVTSVPPEQYLPAEGNLLTTFLRGDWMITLQALVMQKKCLEKIGMFDEWFSVFGDAEFMVRLAAEYSFSYNNNTRAYLEVQPDSISHSKTKRLEAREYMFQKHAVLYNRYPQIRRKAAHKLARAFAIRNEWKKAIQYGLQSLV